MKKQYHAYSTWAPYAFLAPFLLVFSVFLVYPLLQSVILAFHQTFGPEHSEFVMLKNFKDLLHDPLFYIALRNTCMFAAASVFLQLPISLGLAMLLNHPSIRGKLFFRMVIFSPALVGSVFVGVMFAIIFQKRTGLLNIVLNRLFSFNIDFPWLQEYVMPAMILAGLWMWTGYNMVYFLAALQNVDRDLLDSAHVDGAGPFARFYHIILPAIRPIAGFIVLISLIGSFQLFELPFLLFNGESGPEHKGLTVVMHLYQTGFEIGDLGYASAIGWILALILMALAILQRRLSRSEGY